MHDSILWVGQFIDKHESIIQSFSSTVQLVTFVFVQTLDVPQDFSFKILCPLFSNYVRGQGLGEVEVEFDH